MAYKKYTAIELLSVLLRGRPVPATGQSRLTAKQYRWLSGVCGDDEMVTTHVPSKGALAAGYGNCAEVHEFKTPYMGKKVFCKRHFNGSGIVYC